MDDTTTTSATTTNTTNNPITIDSIRLQWSTLIVRMQQHVSIESIRPLTVFLGLTNATVPITRSTATSTMDEELEKANINNDPPVTTVLQTTMIVAPDAYTTPNGKYEMIQLRVQRNLLYYMSNYVFIVAMTSLVIVLMHPSMIFTGFIVYGLYLLHMYWIRHEVILLRCTTATGSNISIQTLLTVPQRMYILSSIAILLILMTCIIPTLLITTISGVIVFTHAILRNSNSTTSNSTNNDLSFSQRSSTKNITNEDEVDPLLSSA